MGLNLKCDSAHQFCFRDDLCNRIHACREEYLPRITRIYQLYTKKQVDVARCE